MSKTKRHRRKHIGSVAIVLIIVLLIIGGLAVLSNWEKQQGYFPSHETEGQGTEPQNSETAQTTGTQDPETDRGSVNEDSDVFKYKEEEYVLKDGIETFLVLGLDSFEHSADEETHRNDQQADFLMLFVVDGESGKYSAVHINRDTMTDINVLDIAGKKINTAYKQIALAHTYGNGRKVSCRNVSDAVSSLMLGMKIDHYVSLTMDSVATLNDLVGGVTVTVNDDFSDVDDTLVQGETVTLRGEQALTYIRSRRGMGDQSDANRMTRQRQYLEAMFGQMIQCAEKDEKFIANVAVEMGDQLISDCTVDQLEELFDKIAEYEFGEICQIEGTYVEGENMEFYHDGNALADIVVKLFYKLKQ